MEPVSGEGEIITRLHAPQHEQHQFTPETQGVPVSPVHVGDFMVAAFKLKRKRKKQEKK